jgi:uridine phosphorylase
MQYPPTELVLNGAGQVYHLGLSADQLADTVILVGDQDRVELVSSFFDRIEHRSQHREFVCHTGFYKDQRVSVLSTGIGTDNIDITLNELDALANIDLVTRENWPTPRRLRLIRIGTCGILHPEIPVHSYILSSHAFGLDNVAHFYQISYSQEELTLRDALHTHLPLPEAIRPYLTSASTSLTAALRSEHTVEGITVTSSGFYGPQGRQLRLKNETAGLNDALSSFSYGAHRVVNFEMESSALFALGRALGHECATICLGIANRPRMEFSKGYAQEMNALIRYVLDRL